MISQENLQSTKQAYEQYVYSDRFYQIVYDSLSDKTIENEQQNLSIYSDCGILLYKSYMDEKTVRDNFLLFENPRRIEISDIKKHADKKPILVINLVFEKSNKFTFLGLDNIIDVSDRINLLIWLMEDNYVFISRYTITNTSNCVCTENYKILELSKFIKLLKNPLELI